MAYPIQHVKQITTNKPFIILDTQTRIVILVHDAMRYKHRLILKLKSIINKVEEIQMSPADIFANITERFDAEKAKDLDLSVLFDLSGDNGGQWVVKVANGKCSADKGTIDNPTATLKMDGDDYVAMTKGDLNPMMAFMSGKIKVDGDLNSVMKFQQLFGM